MCCIPNGRAVDHGGVGGGVTLVLSLGDQNMAGLVMFGAGEGGGKDEVMELVELSEEAAEL